MANAGTQERDASLALRSGHGNRLRKAVGWYRNHDRLHTGDPIAMADDAITAYIHSARDGHDAAIICDKWEIADAINLRLHRSNTAAASPTVRVARDQDVRAGDIIISRNNDAAIDVAPGPHTGAVNGSTRCATATGGGWPGRRHGRPDRR